MGRQAVCLVFTSFRVIYVGEPRAEFANHQKPNKPHKTPSLRERNRVNQRKALPVSGGVPET